MSIIKERSFGLAVKVIRQYQELVTKKEFVLSKQLLRSGTAVGALVREAQNAESKKEFYSQIRNCSKRMRRISILVRVIKSN